MTAGGNGRQDTTDRRKDGRAEATQEEAHILLIDSIFRVGTQELHRVALSTLWLVISCLVPHVLNRERKESCSLLWRIHTLIESYLPGDYLGRYIRQREYIIWS